MKILYLCPDLGVPVLSRKGAAVHVREMATAFSRAGHGVVLAAQTLIRSPWEKPADLQVPVFQARPAPAAAAAVQTLKEFNELLGVENSLPGEFRRILFNAELASELKHRLERHTPDFIYERASLYATAGVSLARAWHVPIILELNAPLALEQATYRATGLGSLAAEVERWTLTHADAIIAVSTQLREHALGLGVEPERVHVMPNGVNPDRFRPSNPDRKLRRRLGLNGGPVLGFVGGLRPWHGVEVLPELFARLAAGRDELRLLIAGDGPLRRDLEREFERRHLEERVVITGLVPHEEVPALIRQFDIALAPYGQPEHAFYFSPLKLFEYMACGAPVVAPGLGQISDVLSDGETGLLYPPGDLEALAAQCERLLRDAELRQKLGLAAVKEVRARFTWERNATRVVELARSLGAKGE